jgi:RimJ/RimL family protein N-acetyltransferase
MVWIELNMDDLNPRYSLRRGTVVEELTGTNFDKLSEFRKRYSHNVKLFDDIRREGFKSFIAYTGGDAAGLITLGVNDYYFEENKFHVHVNPGEVCVYGIWILPEHRRKIITGPMVETALLDFKKSGYRKATGAILTTNTPSLDLAMRLGFKVMYTLRFERILFYQRRPWKIQ